MRMNGKSWICGFPALPPGSSETLVLIDPVIGDNGAPYPTYTPGMCRAMKQLVHLADILTPNVTEACILTDTPYRHDGWHQDELFAMAQELADQGAEKVVISGIPMGQFIGNIVYEKSTGERHIVRRKRVGRERSGTGDIFSTILAADAVNGIPFAQSVGRASSFIQRCMEVTEEIDIPRTDGVCFELVINELK